MHNQKKALFSTNEKESFIAKSFDVKGVNNGTRTLATSDDGVLLAERMVRLEGHRITTGLCTLAIPYTI